LNRGCKLALASHEDDVDQQKANKFVATWYECLPNSNHNNNPHKFPDPLPAVTMLFSNAILIAFAGLVASSPTLGLFSKRAVSCLQVGSSATARWTNSAGQTCTYTGIVGSNYGANPSGSGE
jgi:hypothetical protein